MLYVKVKAVPLHANQSLRGGSRILLPILNLGAKRGGWSTPDAGHFTLTKTAWYPSYRRRGGPQEWSGWIQRISPPLGFEPSDDAAYSESLYQLRYASHHMLYVHDWNNDIMAGATSSS